MDSWLGQLREHLNQLGTKHLHRDLHPIDPGGRIVRRDGQKLVNLASNDYLGLSTHPHLKSEAVRAIQALGTGATASRLVAGNFPIHERVEARFAQFKHAQAALIFPTGYMANLAAVTALARQGDLICVDKLNHASLLDAARASGATVRVFPHRNTAKLERLLARHDLSSADQSKHATRRIIVTDSVFSMDGDTADLPALCDLADQYDAVLIVDEAHATGVLGDSGTGLCELQGVTNRVDVTISTAGKALGGLGGIVTAQREVIETLVNHAHSFIYTTAVPPAQAAVIGAALDVVRDEPWRRHHVLTLAKHLHDLLASLNLAHPHNAHLNIITPIIPIVASTPESALSLSRHLADHGFFAPAIRPPTVPPNTARVRISLRADLEDADLDNLTAALRSWLGSTVH